MNEKVHPQVTQGPQSPNVECDMSNMEIRDDFQALTQLMTTQYQVFKNYMMSQVNLGVGSQTNANTPTSRIQDFVRMNTPTFHGTKVDEDPQGFIDELFKVVNFMGVNPR